MFVKVTKFSEIEVGVASKATQLHSPALPIAMHCGKQNQELSELRFHKSSIHFTQQKAKNKTNPTNETER